MFEVDFTTVDPGVSSQCHWLTVLAQEQVLAPSHVQLRLDPKQRTIEVVAIENVASFELDLARFTRGAADEDAALATGSPIVLRCGEEQLELAFDSAAAIVLSRDAQGTWQVGERLSAWYRGTHRSGSFKTAFRNRMLFVYGTGGSDEENAWSRNKARFDQETWRYRGNGSAELVADVDFDAGQYADRNVILYGNMDTNAAWGGVLDGRAFSLTRETLEIGEVLRTGDDLALLAVYPRKDSEVASVGVVGGTGLAGCRATNNLPYFTSGVAYPDWIVLGTDFLTEGLDGVRGAGFFGPDWSPREGAEAAWRE